MRIFKGLMLRFRGPEDEGSTVGGAEYVAPEGFDASDTATVTKGLDAMDAEFGEVADGGEKKEAPAAPEVKVEEKQEEVPEVKTEPVEGGPNTYKSSTGKLVDTVKPPAGWSPEDALGFETLPEPVRKAIHKREDEFHVGLDAYKAEAHFGHGLRTVITPHMEMIQSAGATPEQAISYLFEINNRLSRGTPEVKLETFRHIMQNNGITAEQLLGHQADEAPYVDPAIALLQNELKQIKMESQRVSQETKLATRQKAEQELDSFFTATPGAEALMADMLPFLKSGLNLQQAYDKAVWTNPTTRQAKIDADAKTKAEVDRKAAEEKVAAAKKASGVNVKSSARHGSPTAPPGSIDETMREIYAKMNS